MRLLERLHRTASPAAVEADAGKPRQPAQRWVIEPARVGLVARATELWRYRRILWFLSGRRIKERYEDTTLGKFWLFARPLMPIAISTVIFGRLLGVPSEGAPYFLFFLTGLSCWRIFERSLLWATRSLEQNRNLIKKVYFPRLVAPISSVAPAIIEFVTLFVLLLASCAFYYVRDGVLYLDPGGGMLLAMLAVVLSVLFAIAVGLWTSVFQVRHRDVQFSLRYVLQFWFYVTPVIYPLSRIPEEYRFVAYLNPMAPLVETYKWGLLGIGEFTGGALVSSVLITLVVFATGASFFNRFETAAVDRL